jgi:hypothetical protein
MSVYGKAQQNVAKGGKKDLSDRGVKNGKIKNPHFGTKRAKQPNDTAK